MNTRKLIFRILKIFDSILNYFTLKFYEVIYSKYPEINGKLIIRGKGRIVFGNNIKINSSFYVNPVGLSDKCAFYAVKGSQIILGNNVGISNSLIYSMDKVEIEDNVLIGGGCQILDNDFHPIDFEKRMIDDNSYTKKKAILIREGSFIGASCIILKGVTIGRKSIVGAGSVVSRNIPDNEIWAGNPAVFIKKI